MAVGLSILVCVLSVGMLAGRIYEILYLTDLSTGFLVTKGIALNAVLTAIFAVIVICCAVILFGKEKTVKPFFSKSSAIFAAVSGVAFIVYGIMTLSQSKLSLLTVAGGVALCLLGITGLGNKIKDAVTILLLTAFVAGICLEVIVFDVYTIYNTAFLSKVMAGATTVLVLLAVLKNVYTPSVFSRGVLYVCGFLCFTFCGMFSIADIVGTFASGNGFSAEIVKSVAMAVFGIYALDNALSVMPKKANVENIDEKEENQQNEVFCDVAINRETVKSEEVSAAKTVVKEGRTVFRTVGSTRQKTEKIVYKKPKE